MAADCACTIPLWGTKSRVADDRLISGAEQPPQSGPRPGRVQLPWRRGFDVRPLLLPLSVLGAIFVVAAFVPPHGYDLRLNIAVDWRDPYQVAASGQFPYRYAPPLALLLAPFGAMPLAAATLLWLAMQLAGLWYIGRKWFLVLVIYPPVWLDLVYGNIVIFLAVAIVASFRRPAAWAFPLLTKVTPGIGVLWFPVRREWRAFAIAMATIAGAVLVSLLLQGWQVWADWFDVLRSSAGLPLPGDALQVPLLPRLIAAALVVSWGAATDRRWTVPVAATMAMPTLWVIALTPLVALASPVFRRTPDDDVLAVA